MTVARPSSGALPSVVVPFGTNTYFASGFSVYEPYTATVEVLVNSPTVLGTSATCSGRTAEAGEFIPVGEEKKTFF